MFDFKNPVWRRRFIVMIVGNVILGLGVCLFKLCAMGNDPSSAFVMSVGDNLGLPFSIMLIIINCIYFALEIIFGRKYIGIGTFFNWIFVGIFADFFVSVITSAVTIPDTFPSHLLIMVIGILVLSLACSMYQTADLGISPYDSLSIMLTDRLPFPYFWCRIFTDSICTILAFVLGGIIGLGTLVCALGLGPFINFFSIHISNKLIGKAE